ncbi:MAG: 50S ribosomal protein L4 [Pirellulaceae bacterium]
MASLPVYDQTGKKVGTYDIDPGELSAEINKQLLHDAVVMYQANQRQGSFRTRNRAEIKGSTRKLYRQKGTGNARAGSRKSGIRRGGGHIFAKRPRDFSYRLPRKALQKATRMAMAGKINDDQVVVIDEWSMSEPRTADVASLLKALDLGGSSILIATESHNPTVYKSARNIPRVNVSHVSDLNALVILQPQRVLITRAALDAMKEGRANKKQDDES